MQTRTWHGEKFWIDLVEKRLYPPESETKYQTTESMLRFLNVQGKTVLDHGCGTGLLGAIAKKQGASVQGIDISETLVAIAQKDFPAQHADIHQLPFADSQFDVVLSMLVLHIVEDITTPLMEIHRVLKKGGMLILGIVHPFSEKWDLKTHKPYQDNSTYDKVEKRTWLFNLTDGTYATAEYYHRPLHDWLGQLLPIFDITEIREPHLSEEYLKTGKYATHEYLFLRLSKKL